MTRRNLVNGQYLQFDWTESDGRSRGNLVSKTLHSAAGTELSTEALYTWSEDNLLLKADTPNVGYSEYQYDAGGDRIHKLYSGGSEVYYIFNGLDVAYEEEITMDGTTKRYYIHALGRHVASVEIDQQSVQKKYFFHADYLGSVRMISDDSAIVVWQKRYTPFGDTEEESGTIENTYQFTGKGWDEDAGLFYFNARWYDAEIGRFISEDPLWGSILDPQSLNRFSYGRNNPCKFVDPTGLWTASADDFADINLDHDTSFDFDPDDFSDFGDGDGGEDVETYKSSNTIIFGLTDKERRSLEDFENVMNIFVKLVEFEHKYVTPGYVAYLTIGTGYAVRITGIYTMGAGIVLAPETFGVSLILEPVGFMVERAGDYLVEVGESWMVDYLNEMIGTNCKSKSAEGYEDIGLIPSWPQH